MNMNFMVLRCRSHVNDSLYAIACRIVSLRIQALFFCQSPLSIFIFSPIRLHDDHPHVPFDLVVNGAAASIQNNIRNNAVEER